MRVQSIGSSSQQTTNVYTPTNNQTDFSKKKIKITPQFCRFNVAAGNGSSYLIKWWQSLDIAGRAVTGYIALSTDCQVAENFAGSLFSPSNNLLWMITSQLFVRWIRGNQLACVNRLSYTRVVVETQPKVPICSTEKQLNATHTHLNRPRRLGLAVVGVVQQLSGVSSTLTTRATLI